MKNPFEGPIVQSVERDERIGAGLHKLKLKGYEFKDGTGHSGWQGAIFAFEVVESDTMARGTTVSHLIPLPSTGLQAEYRRADALRLVNALALSKGLVTEPFTAFADRADDKHTLGQLMLVPGLVVEYLGGATIGCAAKKKTVADKAGRDIEVLDIRFSA